MAELSGPFEICEWIDGQTREFSVLRHELGTMTIQPRDGREAKEIEAMRLHVDPADKPDFPHYWDVTSQRLVGQLRGILPATLVNPFRIKITAIGSAPRTHYSVSRLPERPE
jgi:hypothetical protein